MRAFFFFNDTATTEIYTLSLHDALPICPGRNGAPAAHSCGGSMGARSYIDRKSTRLNSSHGYISYAVFCLKKKNRGRTDGTHRSQGALLRHRDERSQPHPPR